jgi:hypothetical protein
MGRSTCASPSRRCSTRWPAQLGLDPFAVRRANLITPPYRTLNDLQVNSCGLPQCLDAVEQASGWRERRGRLPASGALRRGLGMACSHYVSGSAKPVHWSGEPHAVIQLRLDFDGAITILTGASDIGQGSSNTLLTQIVAEVLLLPMGRIRVVATDSALTPKDNGSYSSRVSFMVGNAALRAAEAMKSALVDAAARAWAWPRRWWSGRANAAAPATPRWTSRRSCRLRWPTGHAVGQGPLVDAAGNPGRQIPGRCGRLQRRLLLRGAGRRGRGRHRHRAGARAAHLGRARLRAGDQPAGGGGSGAGCDLDGPGPGPVEQTQYHEGLPLRPTSSTTAWSTRSTPR